MFVHFLCDENEFICIVSSSFGGWMLCINIVDFLLIKRILQRHKLTFLFIFQILKLKCRIQTVNIVHFHDNIST